MEMSARSALKVTCLKMVNARNVKMGRYLKQAVDPALFVPRELEKVTNKQFLFLQAGNISIFFLVFAQFK